MVEVVDLTLRAVVDFFKFTQLILWFKKNYLQTNFIMSKILFGVAQWKQNKKFTKIIFSIKFPLEGGYILTFPAKSEIGRALWILPDQTKIQKKKINHSEGAGNIDFTY